MSKLLKKLEVSGEDELKLHSVVSKGKHSARKVKRAQVLLKISQGKEYSVIAEEVGVSLALVYNLHHRFEAGQLQALEEKPRPGQPRKVTPEVEAAVTFIACSDAPEGKARWTVALINEKVLELGHEIDDESVRLVLKKAGLSLG